MVIFIIFYNMRTKYTTGVFSVLQLNKGGLLSQKNRTASINMT